VAQNPARFLAAPGSLLREPAAGVAKVDLRGLAAAASARN
jgi:hypothetical protein